MILIVSVVAQQLLGLGYDLWGGSSVSGRVLGVHTDGASRIRVTVRLLRCGSELVTEPGRLRPVDAAEQQCGVAGAMSGGGGGGGGRAERARCKRRSSRSRATAHTSSRARASRCRLRAARVPPRSRDSRKRYPYCSRERYPSAPLDDAAPTKSSSSLPQTQRLTRASLGTESCTERSLFSARRSLWMDHGD